uniref:SDR family oxidoreductase n=1 Tax=Shinella sumterensis TaxID=1967501 RepID=UPI003F834E0E
DLVPVQPAELEVRVRVRDRIAARTALKRWGQPDEVAGAVIFLTMPAARYATGTVYAVDGGFLAG